MYNTEYHFFFKGILSNSAPCNIKYNDEYFANSEQLFMYLKAQSFGDIESCNKILKASNPAEAKDLGRRVSNFNPDVWNNIKYQMMYLAVYSKFSQNRLARGELLIYAGNGPFVECNPVDLIWGIGYSMEDAPHSDPTTWGKNLLGKILDKVANQF